MCVCSIIAYIIHINNYIIWYIKCLKESILNYIVAKDWAVGGRIKFYVDIDTQNRKKFPWSCLIFVKVRFPLEQQQQQQPKKKQNKKNSKKEKE